MIYSIYLHLMNIVNGHRGQLYVDNRRNYNSVTSYSYDWISSSDQPMLAECSWLGQICSG